MTPYAEMQLKKLLRKQDELLETVLLNPKDKRAAKMLLDVRTVIANIEKTSVK